jgi:hypothetical protein
VNAERTGRLSKGKFCNYPIMAILAISFGGPGRIRTYNQQIMSLPRGGGRSRVKAGKRGRVSDLAGAVEDDEKLNSEK